MPWVVKSARTHLTGMRLLPLPTDIPESELERCPSCKSLHVYVLYFRCKDGRIEPADAAQCANTNCGSLLQWESPVTVAAGK